MATKESITDKGMRAAGLKTIPAGSVLLTSRATIGITAINAMPLVTNQGFQNLIVNGGTDALWLYYFVSEQRTGLRRMASGSTFGEVSGHVVRSFPILLPPLPEQRTIAAMLDSIDGAIEGAEAVIAATERLRGALLHELLTRGVPGWHTAWREAPGVGSVPADWEVVRLGEVAEVRKGKSFTSRDLIPGDVPVIAGGMSPAYYHASSNRPANTITVSASGAYAGFVALHRYPILATDCTTVRSCEETPTIEFIHHFLKHLQHSIYYRRRGSAQPHVYPEDIAALPLSVPPLPEQRAITAVLDGVDMAVGLARAERDVLQSVKASAADALLTGRVRVSIDKEAANV